MKSVIIDDIKEFVKIQNEWDKALVDSGADNPFLLSDFIITWWKYYGKNRKLNIFLLSDGKNIIAGMPLFFRRQNFFKTLSYIGGPAANTTHFFSVDKNLNFIEQLFLALSQRKGWDIAQLDRVLSTNPLLYELENFRPRTFDNIGYVAYDSDSNGIIDLSDGYDAVQKNLPKRLRRYLSSCRKRAEQIGELRLEEAHGALDVRGLFDTLKTFSIDSFKKRKARSAFNDSRYGDFFAEILEIFDKKDRLDAHRLLAGKEVLAASFGYRFGGGFKWILTAFNPAFSDLRPGHLLINELVRKAAQRGDAYFDMYYGGGLFYKKQWCTRQIPIKRVRFFRKSIAARAVVLAEKKLRLNPYIMNFARRIKNF